MNKFRLTVYALTLTFAVLLFSAATTNEVSADINCRNVKSCSGDAGCGSGSIDGCTINCTSGNVVLCTGG